MDLLLFRDTSLGSGDSDLCRFLLVVLTKDKQNRILDQSLSVSSQLLAVAYSLNAPLIYIYISFRRSFYPKPFTNMDFKK